MIPKKLTLMKKLKKTEKISVLNHSLDGSFTRWACPIRSTTHRVNGYDPLYSTAYRVNGTEAPFARHAIKEEKKTKEKNELLNSQLL